jgi:rfaE bifunctional protein nucleotidyltransferase chain/domain
LSAATCFFEKREVKRDLCRRDIFFAAFCFAGKNEIFLYIKKYCEKKMQTTKKRIVYVDGCFDLFHVGHVRLFEKAKAFGDYLIAGVISDKDVKSYKREPIISEEDRAQVVAACSLVDRVIVNSPLILTREFLEKHKIDIVVHGDDDPQTEFFKACGDRMRYVPYDQHISTSAIIKRVCLLNTVPKDEDAM